MLRAMLSGLGSLRYQQAGKRDLRLDLLRGYALFVMAIDHTEIPSYWYLITGNLRFFINAADAFFFISGLTLGIISRGKEVSPTIRAQLRRIGKIYVYAVFLALCFVGLYALGLTIPERMGHPIPQWGVILRALTLQQTFGYSNILIVYLVYFSAAIPALIGLLSGRTGIVVAAIVGVYAFSQFFPEATISVLLALRVWLFRNVIANAPVFFVPLVIGFHREEIAAWWARQRFARAADILIVLIGLVGLGWFIMASLGWYDGDLPINRDLSTMSSDRMPPLAVLAVFLYMRILWLTVTILWKPLHAVSGWFLLPLGQHSLFTFVMHPIIMVFYLNIPGVEPGIRRSIATLWNTLYLALLYGALLLRNALRMLWTSFRARSAPT